MGSRVEVERDHGRYGYWPEVPQYLTLLSADNPVYHSWTLSEMWQKDGKRVFFLKWWSADFTHHNLVY